MTEETAAKKAKLQTTPQLVFYKYKQDSNREARMKLALKLQRDYDSRTEARFAHECECECEGKEVKTVTEVEVEISHEEKTASNVKAVELTLDSSSESVELANKLTQETPLKAKTASEVETVKKIMQNNIIAMQAEIKSLRTIRDQYKKTAEEREKKKNNNTIITGNKNNKKFFCDCNKQFDTLDYLTFHQKNYCKKN